MPPDPKVMMTVALPNLTAVDEGTRRSEVRDIQTRSQGPLPSSLSKRKREDPGNDVA